MTVGDVAIRGQVKARKIAAPGPGWAWKLRNGLRWMFLWGWVSNLLARGLSAVTGIPTMTAELRAVHVGADGRRVNYGVLSRRLVTTAFVNFVVDQLQTETSVFGDFKYHDSGVGTTAENVANTAMETTDGESRATGTQTEGAANVYVSVGTISYTTTKAITEHGLFNDPTAGTLMDRSVFSAINVVNGDSIQFSYSLSVNSGG
jgi:hypothetical protein